MVTDSIDILIDSVKQNKNKLVTFALRYLRSQLIDVFIYQIVYYLISIYVLHGLMSKSESHMQRCSQLYIYVE